MHYLKKSLVFLLLLFFIEFSLGRDTLSMGQTLKDKDDDFLTSAKATFILRFFSPRMSTNRYLGIWNNILENRVVWVANRDNPVKDTSGVVSFYSPNILAIYGSDLKGPIWSTSFLGPGKNYSAQLLDTGNLIVFEEDRKRVIVWQSFDHPTHTWLPEMKLGLNRKTGLNRSLRSWKSFGDPGNGEYSMRMDVIREFSELSLYKGSNRIWRSGPFNRARLGEISPRYFFNVTYVDNEDEVYMTYGMRALSTFSVMTVIPYGFMMMSEWNADMLNWKEAWALPSESCDDYNYCGPNEYCTALSTVDRSKCSCFPGFERNKNPKIGEGCVRKRDRNVCQSGEGFVKVSSLKMPDTTTARVDRIMGLKECEEECLRNCNCTAYANATEMGIACVMWYGNLLDTRKYERGGQNLFIRVDAVELDQKREKQQHHSSSNKKRKVATVVTSAVVVASIAGFLSCWLTHKIRKGGLHLGAEKKPANLLNGLNNSTPSQTHITEPFDERQASGDLPFFDLISLAKATNNFSDNNKLGQGGFGSVYKGTLKNGQEIAVKRLSETSTQGVVEFKNEATLISQLEHRNLVRLLGCCAEQDEKLLIYEFMPNKSLDSLIFDKTEGSCLDWARRFSIIMGIIRGMVYLHQDCRYRIIHRDLKASNILLDAQMNPKISDFGMARFFANDEVEAITKRIVGTYGYMAPEYAMQGIFSIKSDVFSFGVLLLEIISGRKNNNYYNDNYLDLILHVWHLWSKKRALEIVDSSLGGDYSAKTVLRCIHVGLLSVEKIADHRPTMSEIASMLSTEEAMPLPTQPTF